MNSVTNLIIIAVVATIVVLYLRSTHLTLRRSKEVKRMMLDAWRRAKLRRELHQEWKDWITLHGYDLATYNTPAAWLDLLRNDPDAARWREWLTNIGTRWEQLRKHS
jgi:hypothetical protein